MKTKRLALFIYSVLKRHTLGSETLTHYKKNYPDIIREKFCTQWKTHFSNGFGSWIKEMYSAKAIGYFGISYYRKYIFELGETLGNFAFQN